MLFVTALFGGLMLLSVESRRRMVAVLLIAVSRFSNIAPPAQAQLPFCLPCVIQAVLNTITVTIAAGLPALTSYWESSSRSSRRQYGRSQRSTSRSRRFDRSSRSSLVCFSRSCRSTRIPPRCLTPLLLRASFAIGVRLTFFRAAGLREHVPGGPSSRQHRAAGRDLTDMDDAMAQDNLMMLKESDQAQDLQLQLANQIESLVGNPASISRPGVVVADYGGSRSWRDPEPSGDTEDAGSHVAARSGTRRTRQRHPKTQCRLRRTTANGHD